MRGLLDGDGALLGCVGVGGVEAFVALCIVLVVKIRVVLSEDPFGSVELKALMSFEQRFVKMHVMRLMRMLMKKFVVDVEDKVTMGRSLAEKLVVVGAFHGDVSEAVTPKMTMSAKVMW